MAEGTPDTALATARRRFVASLGKKASELRASALVLAASGTSTRAFDELRRRMHALHASAMVFREDDAAAMVADALGTLDAARADGLPLPDPVLEGVVALARRLSTLAGEELPDAELDVPTLVGADAPSKGGRGTRDAAPPPPVVHAEPTLVSVLLVGDACRRIAATLAADRFEVQLAGADDAELAARVGAPDVIVVGTDVPEPDRARLLRAFRAEPSVDLAPVLLADAGPVPPHERARIEGFDDAFVLGANPDDVREKLVRASGHLPSGREPALGTTTLRGLSARLAAELERGLVTAAKGAADEPLALGDGTEIFAAVWYAIARVRTAVVDRAGERIRFDDGDRREGRSVLALGADTTQRGDGTDVSLAGRRILVCDDDPAVLWFFSGLLRDAGAEVVEAPDGQVGLDLARRRAPDLVLTDILMPRLDGLALTRAMRRDPLLADVPVIFLSWKDDFLQRMRELRADAAGYLRKEEAGPVILDRVRDAFRPRIRFEQRLETPGEVRGRLEGLSVLALVRSVAAIRRDARVTVRDVRNVFELDLRAGQVVELVRTGTDGSFARGTRALSALLGVSAGRFAVLPPVFGHRTSHAPLDAAAIERAAQRLAAMCDAAAGRGLALADRVELDDDEVASIVALSPPGLVEVVRRLRENPSPRRWLLSGEVEPDALAAAMAELARRGAVTAVRGEHGEDLVALALEQRGFASLLPEDPEPVDESGLEEVVDDALPLSALVEESQAALERRNSVVPPPAFVPPTPDAAPEVVAATVARLVAPRDEETLRVRTDRTTPAPVAAERTGFRVVTALLLVAVVVLGGMLVVELRRDRHAGSARPRAASPAAARAASGRPTSAPSPALPAPATTPAATPVDDPSDPWLYGVFSTPSEPLPEGRGELQVACPEGALVRLDQGPLEPCAPRSVLAPGPHRLEWVVADVTYVRFVRVEAGRTLRLDDPSGAATYNP